MPKRIQMHRRPGGWRQDHPFAVIVDRSTEWGNPFRVGASGVPDQATAVHLFAAAMTLRCSEAVPQLLRGLLNDELGGLPHPEGIATALRGKDLACWCPLDQLCHADVLLDLANKDR